MSEDTSVQPRRLYPFVVALYSVLALAVQMRVMAPLPLLVTAISALAIALLCWLIATLITRVLRRRDADKRALLALVGVTSCLGYGYFVRALRASALPEMFHQHRNALPAWTLLIAVCGALVLFARRDLSGASRFFGRFALILLVLPPVLAAFSSGQRASARGAAPPRALAPALPLPATVPRSAAAQPDIYLIVLDKYSGTRSLAENYGFRNDGFAHTLREKGFVVPADARANYIHTFLALASMLNWADLDEVAQRLGLRGTDQSRGHELVENNRAVRFLQSRGYQFVFFPSTFEATKSSRYADVTVRPPTAQPVRKAASSTRRTVPALGGLLAIAWWHNTPASLFISWQCLWRDCEKQEFPYPIEPAESLEWKFQQLAQLPDSQGPKFVFAHLLLPHEPYLFNVDCSHRDPYWPMGDTGAVRPLREAAYLQQVQCANRMLGSLVDQLIAKSRTPPVILLQSDHGHGGIALDPIIGKNVPLDRLTPGQLRERTNVFAAYYLPGVDDRLVHDSISAINVLPIVLNHYFGTSIPLKPDASYWSEFGLPYRFTKVR